MEAHTFSRIVAFFIDIILLSLLLSLLTFWIPTSKSYKEALENENTIMEKYRDNKINSSEFLNQYFENYYVKDKENIITSVISIVLSLGYFGTFAFYNNGQTLGKKLMKIKVSTIDGKNPSHLSLVIRSLIINSIFTSILSCILILFITKNQYIYTIGILQVLQSFIMLISLLMIAFSKGKRGLHDLLTRTKVIQCE